MNWEIVRQMLIIAGCAIANGAVLSLIVVLWINNRWAFKKDSK